MKNEPKKDCEYCEGTGKVVSVEPVYEGGAIYADIGVEKDCICVIEE